MKTIYLFKRIRIRKKNYLILGLLDNFFFLVIPAIDRIYINKKKIYIYMYLYAFQMNCQISSKFF